MRFITLFSLAAALALGACGRRPGLQYTQAGFRPQAQKLGYVAPLSGVKLVVGERMPAHPDPFLSAMVARQLKGVLLGQQRELHLTTEVVVDSLQRPLLLAEINQALRQMLPNKSLVDSPSCPQLQQLVQGQPQRYTLLLMCEGFTMVKDRYTRAYVYGANSQVVTGIGRMPIKAGIWFSLIVYDSQSQQIVLAHSSLEEHEPLDNIRNTRHLLRLAGRPFGLMSPTP